MRVINKHFLVSLVMHLSLLALMFKFIQLEKIGNNTIPSIPAYIATISQNSITPQKTQRRVDTNGLEKKQAQQAKPRLKQQTKANSSTVNDIHNALLKLLHEEIAARQTYPENALQLNQSGTVKIGFVLSPDGHLTDIGLIKSSGFASIDQSALASVQSLPPVRQAIYYLKSPEHFSVDVIFS